jgi:DNA processing protein
MHMNRSNIILHFSLINDVGPVTIQKLVAALDTLNAWENVYELTVADCTHHFNFSPGTAAKIIDGLANKKAFDQELELITKHAISWVTLADPEYPALLAAIYAPPAVLYWKGRAPNTYTQTVAIVGSRLADFYAKKVLDELAPVCAHHKINIVSGGALGADSMAHRAAVHARDATVVVLGSGLLCPSPLQNVPLFNQVIETGGTVMSIFPLQALGLPGNFPARNRIISGLSKLIFVVQAAQKSGALITAKFALDQGRDVLALPGRIDDPLSQGTNWLLQQGAGVYLKPADLLAHFGIHVVEKISPHKKAMPVAVVNMQIDGTTVEQDNDQNFSPAERSIIALCKEPMSVDEVMVATGLSLGEVQEKLFGLAIVGKIEQDLSGLWHLI